jgi:hypothetical protein
VCPEGSEAQPLQCRRCQRVFSAGAGAAPARAIRAAAPPREKPVEAAVSPTDATVAPQIQIRRLPNTDTKSRALIILLCVGGVCVLLAVISGVVSSQQYRLLAASKNEPQTIRCRDLIDHGPGDNVFVHVTDFQLLGDDIVIVQKNRGASAEPWEKAWIPVMPQTEPDRSSADVIVLLETDRVRSGSELRQLQQSPRIRGMVVNGVASLGAAEKAKLRERYPQINFEKSWLIRHEITPQGTALFAQMTGVLAGIGVLGALVCLGAAGLLYLTVRRQKRAAQASL